MRKILISGGSPSRLFVPTILMILLFTFTGCSTQDTSDNNILRQVDDNYLYVPKELNRYTERFSIARATAVAGPDLRWDWDGELRPLTYVRGENVVGLNFFAAKYKYYKTKKLALLEAETQAIKACERQLGLNECYIWYSDGIDVRKARRKSWLKSRPDVQKSIKLKIEEYKRLNAQAQKQSKQSNSGSAISSAISEPNYQALSEFGRNLAKPQSKSSTCHLTSQQASGFNKICYYNCLGSTHAQNVMSTQMCPLSIVK